MDEHRSLAIFVGREFLSPHSRYRCISRNHLFCQPAYRLQTQRKWQYIQQQHLVIGLIANQNIRLDRCTDGNHFVGIHVIERRFTEILRDLIDDLRDPCGATHQDNIMNLTELNPGIPYGSQACFDRSINQRRH